MNKLSIVIAGLLFSGAASAVQFTTSANLTQVDCPNLNEDVRLNLTTGVVAGTNCRAASGTGATAIPARVAIAACHTGGMQKSRSITQRTDSSTSPPTIITGCVVGTDAGCAVATATGAAVPGATTLAGTVNIGYPGTGACTAAAAETQAGTL